MAANMGLERPHFTAQMLRMLIALSMMQHLHDLLALSGSSMQVKTSKVMLHGSTKAVCLPAFVCCLCRPHFEDNASLFSPILHQEVSHHPSSQGSRCQIDIGTIQLQRLPQTVCSMPNRACWLA